MKNGCVVFTGLSFRQLVFLFQATLRLTSPTLDGSLKKKNKQTKNNWRHQVDQFQGIQPCSDRQTQSVFFGIFKLESNSWVTKGN